MRKVNAMVMRNRRRLAQLVLGRSERERFSIPQVLDCLSLATRVAGLNGLLYWPTRDAAIDAAVLGRARELGLELYLWLPVLADAGVDWAEADLTEDAWGNRGYGASGRWANLGHGDETFLFACPNAPAPLEAARGRIRGELPDYDGVFLDRIRYPSPANGLEAVFTCFCPRCRERHPRSGEWRDKLRDKIDALLPLRASDRNFSSTLGSLLDDPDLSDYRLSRIESVNRLVATLAGEAKGQGRKVALDLLAPNLTLFTGQCYETLGKMADWIKPMYYCRARGPAGLPLELACFARGIKAWCPKVDESDIMEYVGQIGGIPNLPASADEVELRGLDENCAGDLYARDAKHAAYPIFPGFECVRHPDFDLDMTEEGVRKYCRAFHSAPGIVLAWNILYTPEAFLRIVAEDSQ